MSETLQSLVKLQLKRSKDGISSFDIRKYSNYRLAYGEPFYDVIHQKLYVGDGETPLSELQPINTFSSAREITQAINADNSAKINSAHIEGDVSGAYYLQGTAGEFPGETPPRYSLKRILDEAGIKSINNIGAGSVVTEVRKNEQNGAILDVVKGDNIFFNGITSPYTIGGIQQGTDLTGMSIQDVLLAIFSGVYTPISDFSFTLNIEETLDKKIAKGITPTFTSGSSPISSFRVTCNGELLLSLNSVVSGTEYNFTTFAQGTDFTVHAEISDGRTTLTYDVQVIKDLTYTVFWGILPNGITDLSGVTESVVKGLSSDDFEKPGVDKVLSLPYGFVNVQYVAIAYPQLFGDIILTYPEDPEYDDTNLFPRKEMLITLDGVQVPYYVYMKSTIVYDENCTYHYKFGTMAKYVVTFKDWDNTTLKTENVVKYQKATAPANPTRTGYDFVGWDTDFSCIERDTTVTAQYEEQARLLSYWGVLPNGITNINDVTESIVKNLANSVAQETPTSGTVFNAPYGFVNIQYVAYAYPASFGDIVLTYPEDPEYDDTNLFARKAINITNDGITTQYYVYMKTTIVYDENCTYHYKFGTMPTYTVTFKDWDDTTLKTETVTKYQSATAPANPTREGYDFVGWDNSFDCIERDTTVTAQYQAQVESTLYFGVLPNGVTSENITRGDVEALETMQHNISSGETLSLNYGIVDYQLVAFAYPKKYGSIANAYWDDPTYNEISSFDVKEMILDDDLYVYVKKVGFEPSSGSDDYIYNFVFN